MNGVTFTVNDDKSVTINTPNGPSTAQADFFLAGTWSSTAPTLLPDNHYKVSMMQNVDTVDRGVYLHIVKNTSVLMGVNTISEYRLIKNEITGVYLSVNADKTFDNYTVYPMICYADVSDNTYEPYTPSLQEQVSQNTSTISQLEIGGVYLYNKSSYGTFDEGYVMRVGNQIHINCKITMTKKVDKWVSVIVLPFAVKTPDDSDRYTIQQTQSDGRTTSVYINKGGTTSFFSSTVLEIGDVIEIKGLILDMYIEETATVTE